MVSAKPAQGAEPVQCSGAAKIKPPFEIAPVPMGQSCRDFDRPSRHKNARNRLNFSYFWI